MTVTIPACQDVITMAKAIPGIDPRELLSSSEELEVALFLDFLEAGLRVLSQKLTQSYWSLYSRGNASNIEENEKVWCQVLTDPSVRQRLILWKKRAKPGTLQRRLEILHRYSLLASFENITESRQLLREIIQQVSSRHTKSVATTNKKSVTHERKIRENTFRTRAKISHDLSRRFARLLSLRTNVGKQIEKQDYFSARLTSCTSLSFLEQLLEQIEQKTEKPYQKALKEIARQLGIRKVAVWDLAYDPEHLEQKLAVYLPFHGLIARAREFLYGMGLEKALEHITFETDPFQQNLQQAYCFSINPPEDIRILLTPNSGPGTLRLLFHELGHAVYEAQIPFSSFAFQSAPSDTFSEGIAEFFASQSEEISYLCRVLDIPKKLANRYQKRRALERLIATRQLLAAVHFERQAYLKPSQNLDNLWRKIAERFLRVSIPENSLGWVILPSMATHPVYFQNYLFANAISSQLRAYCEKQFGSIWGNPQVGRFLQKQIFQFGASYPWQTLLENSIDTPFDSSIWLSEFTR